MGYRSNVRMVIRGPQELILREFANLRLTGDETMQKALDEWKVMEDGRIVFRPGLDPGQTELPAAVAILGKGGTDWKWYENYPDVQAHERVFNHFRELYENTEGVVPEAFLEGSFVRIGEDHNDIHHENFGDSGYDLAYPSTQVYCPYDHADGDDLRPRLATSEA